MAQEKTGTRVSDCQGPAGAFVGDAAPQFDHLAAADVDGDGGAEFGEVGVVAGEGVGDRAVPFVGPAVVVVALVHGWFRLPVQDCWRANGRRRSAAGGNDLMIRQ
ncbi:hypothetical protein [Kitasatospora sp. MBT66]|uniref:hypothetical protein n=1 Tax=Kitasatospora sp. MBT66 TaxID=1444769 RepID=UPI0035180F1E